MTDTTNHSRRKGWIAGLLSLLMPGLGQVYNGELRTGVRMFVFGWLMISLITNDFLGRGRFVLSWLMLPVLYSAYGVWEAASSARYMVYPPEKYNRWYVYAAVLGMGFGVAVLFRATIANARRITGMTMEDSIKKGEQVLVRQWGIGGLKGLFAHDPDIQRGDIIVFEASERMRPLSGEMPAKRRSVVRRVIGMGGDEVLLKDSRLYLNGRLKVEPYARERDPREYPAEKFGTREEYQKLWEAGKLSPHSIESLRDNFGPVTVPAGTFFVLGDNRDRSRDSRFWGPISDDMIQGRIVRVLWSWDSDAHRVRWNRIAQPVQ
jgi:signal peptidase I